MIVKKNFGGAEVTFEPSLINGNVMVNANQMAKIFGKEVSGYLKTDQTENFVKAFCQTEDLPFENEFSPKGKLVKIIKGHHTVNGTWMHRIVALDFAVWLDPFFAVWVFKTIDEILFAHAHELDESIRRSVIISQELRELEKKADKSGEDFERFIKLKNQEVNERSLRAQSTKSRFREFYRDLKPQFATN
jgi:hypothetical protein